MTASRIDITIEQGVDFRQAFSLAGLGLTPDELTGASAAMQVRTQIGDPTALLTLTTGDGGLTINPTDLEIVATISWSVTQALLGGTGVHDILMLLASGRYLRTHQGTVTISPEVTTFTLPPPSAGSASYLLLGVF